MLRRALRAHEHCEFDKAERLYAAVLRTLPNNFDALHGLGLINYQRGRLDAALALIQAALQADIDRADGFASLGLVFHALKQFERALGSYNEGLRLAPENIELINRRGVALLKLGRPGEALQNLERVLAAVADRQHNRASAPFIRPAKLTYNCRLKSPHRWATGGWHVPAQLLVRRRDRCRGRPQAARSHHFGRAHRVLPHRAGQTSGDGEPLR